MMLCICLGLPDIYTIHTEELETMPTISTIKIPMNYPKDLVDEIDKRVAEIGCGATRTGYVLDAVKKQLKKDERAAYDPN